MPTATAAARAVEWIDKHEVHRRTGLSIRRVLELAKDGRWRTRDAFSQKLRQYHLEHHAGDVEAYIEERNRPKPPAWAKSEDLELAQVAQRPFYNPQRESPVATILNEIRQLQQMLATTPKPEGWNKWLTLAEAAEISNLPVAFLERLIRRGELPHADCGSGEAKQPAGRYRVRRADLEAIQAKRRTIDAKNDLAEAEKPRVE